MTTKLPTISIRGNRPDDLIGCINDGKEIIGWARTGTAPSRYVGFNTFETEIVLKYKDGTCSPRLLQTQGQF